jgi:hypothetical protein
MNKRERLAAAIAGQSVDRVPVALWRHFPGDDQAPAALAAATVAFQRRWDFDFVKVTPASSFQIKDWGAQDAWQGNIEGTRQYASTPYPRERLARVEIVGCAVRRIGRATEVPEDDRRRYRRMCRSFKPCSAHWRR